MKIILSLLFSLLIGFSNGQDSTKHIIKVTKIPDSLFGKPDNTPVRNISINNSSDTRPHNKYGDLLNDDPAFNRKYPLWIPLTRVVMADGFTWSIDRFILNADFSKIGFDTWNYNLHHGWEWDNDHFGTNFIGHPYSGNVYFNVARSNGYNYPTSFLFSVEGSLIWELFGENTKPSINDIINTPVSGSFLGEIVYRISSNILDESARGSNRVWREILAGIVDPSRALNRLTQGKMFRVNNKEVYQKEPLNITISTGLHKVNDNNKFFSGATNYNINLQFDYGDPFEVRHRKPFDVFRLRTETSLGNNRKLLDNVTGYGLLIGKNVTTSNNGLLLGGFQYYDYWNNKIFELGTLGFGPGLISRVHLQKRSLLYSSLHIAIVPLAGNNTSFGPDTSKFRDYNFGGGFEAKIEEMLSITRFLSIGFNGYYYWLHNYENLPGRSSIGILKPRVVINFSKNASLGFEHHIYYVNRFLNNISTLHLNTTEQKVFFQVFLEDSKRRDKYH